MYFKRLWRIIFIICVKESNVFSVWRDNWSIKWLIIALLLTIKVSHSVKILNINLLILNSFFTSIENLNSKFFFLKIVAYFQEIIRVIRKEESLFVISIIELVLSRINWWSHKNVFIHIIIILGCAHKNKVFRHTRESLLGCEIDSLIIDLWLEDLFITSFLTFLY